MAKEAVARAIGAGHTLEVEGKEYDLVPLTMRGLMAVQREAVNYYKRQVLQSYTENADLLPEDMRREFIAEKFSEITRWDVSDCPTHEAFSYADIEVTQPLLIWLQGEYPALEISIEDADRIKVLIGAALDAGELSKTDYIQMCGKLPPKAKIPYDTWWVSSVQEGQLAMLRQSVLKDGEPITSEELQTWPTHSVIEACKAVELLTIPEMGNI